MSAACSLLTPTLRSVQYHETIGDLKRKVEEKTGVPSDKQQARALCVCDASRAATERRAALLARWSC